MIKMKNESKAGKQKDDMKNKNDYVMMNDRHDEHQPLLVGTEGVAKHVESQGANFHVQTEYEAKPVVEELETNRKIKSLLYFWEGFVIKGLPKSGGIRKEFPIKSFTGGVKLKGQKVTHTRGTRIYKTKIKVKSTPDKTPLKGRLVQSKLNLKPIRLNLIQDELTRTSTDELTADNGGIDTVDQRLDG